MKETYKFSLAKNGLKKVNRFPTKKRLPSKIYTLIFSILGTKIALNTGLERDFVEIFQTLTHFLYGKTKSTTLDQKIKKRKNHQENRMIPVLFTASYTLYIHQCNAV